jgi:hypothetical protein
MFLNCVLAEQLLCMHTIGQIYLALLFYLADYKTQLIVFTLVVI